MASMSSDKDRNSKPRNGSSQKTPLQRTLEGILEQVGNDLDAIARALNPARPIPQPIPIPIPVYRRRRG
jgi:hypothetical protein